MAQRIVSNLYANYSRNARTRSIEFAISRPHFARLLRGDCYICGSPPMNKRTIRGLTLIYNGIDRVDNKKGYVRGNVKPCCRTCNSAKSQLSLSDLKTHLTKMLEGLKGVA